MAQAAPPHPSMQLQTPGATHRPLKLQDCGHTGTSHRVPCQPPKHLHVGGDSSSAASYSSLSAHTQSPCTQPSEQERDEQSKPPQPATQAHVPTAVHFPRPLQPLGQRGSSQASPLQPESQLHIVMPFPVARHRPWPEQCLEQLGMLQSAPVHPERQRHRPGASQTPRRSNAPQS